MKKKKRKNAFKVKIIILCRDDISIKSSFIGLKKYSFIFFILNFYFRSSVQIFSCGYNYIIREIFISIISNMKKSLFSVKLLLSME